MHGFSFRNLEWWILLSATSRTPRGVIIRGDEACVHDPGGGRGALYGLQDVAAHQGGAALTKPIPLDPSHLPIAACTHKHWGIEKLIHNLLLLLLLKISSWLYHCSKSSCLDHHRQFLNRETESSEHIWSIVCGKPDPWRISGECSHCNLEIRFVTLWKPDPRGRQSSCMPGIPFQWALFDQSLAP